MNPRTDPHAALPTAPPASSPLSPPLPSPPPRAAAIRPADRSGGWRAAWSAFACRLGRWIGHDLLALLCRVGVAAIFFLSGRTKVEGVLSVSEGAVELFRSEYRLPLLPPEVAAHLAAYAEHLFPLLLVLGLLTRLSALALLGMTLVIQLFVYPDAWPTHLSWAALLLYLVGRGAGRFSLDRGLRID